MARKVSREDVRKMVNEIGHPLMVHKLTMLRNRETNPSDFRMILQELSGLLAYEVLRDLKLMEVPQDTPMEPNKGLVAGEPVVMVPVMRAGLGMLDGMLRMAPFAKVGHVGIYRDKQLHSTVEYFFRLPKDVEGSRVVILDPLLATGDTAIATIHRLKEYNVTNIHFVTIIAAPEGVARLKEEHPDVKIWTITVDRCLNEKGYILPGLGDAGDRIYGTL